MSEEKQAAGAGYILSFFNDIEQLTTYFASYLNVMLVLRCKYGDAEKLRNLEGLEEQDRVDLVATAQGMRTWIVRSYVKAKALQDKITGFGNVKIDDAYKKATGEFIVNPEVIEEYVIEINRVFADEMLSDLLIRAYDIAGRLTQ